MPCVSAIRLRSGIWPRVLAFAPHKSCAFEECPVFVSIHLSLTNSLVPAAEKHFHNTVLPSPCFTLLHHGLIRNTFLFNSSVSYILISFISYIVDFLNVFFFFCPCNQVVALWGGGSLLSFWQRFILERYHKNKCSNDSRIKLVLLLWYIIIWFIGNLPDEVEVTACLK